MNASDYARVTYNSVGDVTAIRRRDGRVITQSFNNVGQLTARNIPGAPNEAYTYDMAGRLTRVTGGVSLQYQYDALGRVTEKSHGSSHELPIRYGYDSAGRQSTLTYPDGYEVNYIYDNLSRIRLVREGTRVLADVYYDGR